MFLSRITNQPGTEPRGTRYRSASRLRASCVVCGHEDLRSGPGRVTCPMCGATLRIQALDDDLEARRRQGRRLGRATAREAA